MRRREFITLLSAAWPLAGRAQQGERMRHIGVLMNASEGVAEARANVAALREALQQLFDYGYQRGRSGRLWQSTPADFKLPSSS